MGKVVAAAAAALVMFAVLVLGVPVLLVVAMLGGAQSAAACPPPAGAVGGGPVPAGAMTPLEVARVARTAGFPDDQLVTAVAVAGAESGWNPAATHLNNDGSTDLGLWQINTVHTALLARYPWRNPAGNAAMAVLLWRASGWSPWVTYTTGAYRTYLPAARAAVAQLDAAPGGGGTPTAPPAGQPAPAAGPACPDPAGGVVGSATGTAAQLLRNPRVSLTPNAAYDLAHGIVGAQVVNFLTWYTNPRPQGAGHAIAISVFSTGHSLHVHGTNRVSNHVRGCAADIYQVDGTPVVARTGQIQADAAQLAGMTGPVHPDELGQPWAQYAGTSTLFRVFSDADHQNHFHVGWDSTSCTGGRR